MGTRTNSVAEDDAVEAEARRLYEADKARHRPREQRSMPPWEGLHADDQEGWRAQARPVVRAVLTGPTVVTAFRHEILTDVVGPDAARAVGDDEFGERMRAGQPDRGPTDGSNLIGAEDFADRVAERLMNGDVGAGGFGLAMRIALELERLGVSPEPGKTERAERAVAEALVMRGELALGETGVDAVDSLPPSTRRDIADRVLSAAGVSEEKSRLLAVLSEVALALADVGAESTGDDLADLPGRVRTLGERHEAAVAEARRLKDARPRTLPLLGIGAALGEARETYMLQQRSILTAAERLSVDPGVANDVIQLYLRNMHELEKSGE